jgi:FixJ family two-component response regulator
VTEVRSIIAVIDDDESMCQALSRFLLVAGYEVRTYFSAEAFLDDPSRDQTRFVVADIQLRGMSGFDLQRRLQQDRPGLPVVFITAHDEAATRSEARDSGCVAYLRKPFPGSLLIGAIRSALGQPANGAVIPRASATPTDQDDPASSNKSQTNGHETEDLHQT